MTIDYNPATDTTHATVSALSSIDETARDDHIPPTRFARQPAKPNKSAIGRKERRTANPIQPARLCALSPYPPRPAVRTPTSIAARTNDQRHLPADPGRRANPVGQQSPQATAAKSRPNQKTNHPWQQPLLQFHFRLKSFNKL
jgi:hypothetical protein